MYTIWDDQMPLKIEGNEQIPQLSPFLVTDKKTGAVIVLPGGGYEELMEHEGPQIAKWLQSKGISAFVLNYRVKPYRHPASLLDVQRAIKYLRANADAIGIDKTKIAVLGFSSGGHLAATVATLYDKGIPNSESLIECQSSRPDAAVVCYGPISIVDLNLQMINLLGDRENQSEDERLLLSVEKNVTEDTPPTFLWHTGEDECVHPLHPLLFAQAMAKYRLNCELHLYAKGCHGLELARNERSVGTWTQLCEKWLEDQGFKG
jgi:acetyl esterase/lipase